ncbi:hypothetical protein KIW84_043043 [Lathyrus oleraceus]|uniref:Uncharacterized protein n=1 Tax=Pisum sativum TaxID=3888 RepID=A0A9D4XGD7_PEA|nr:hypothetical protein KIW84_043043 [Pisum sativum]
MGTTCIDGQTKPTWKLTDGVSKESLAFETARREGVPEVIIKRAEDLYLSVYSKKMIYAEIFAKQEGMSTYVNGNNLNGTHLHSKRPCSQVRRFLLHTSNQYSGKFTMVNSPLPALFSTEKRAASSSTRSRPRNPKDRQPQARDQLPTQQTLPPLTAFGDHQRLTKHRSSWEQEIRIEAETSEEQARKVSVLVDFFLSHGFVCI